MEALESGDLSIRVDRSAPACLRLDWVGRSAIRDPMPIILPFFDRVLMDAIGTRSRIEMHFEALEYFNSSTITALMHLINSSVEASVRLRIYYNAERTWQVLSFEALKRAVAMTAGPSVEFYGTYGRAQ